MFISIIICPSGFFRSPIGLSCLLRTKSIIVVLNETIVVEGFSFKSYATVTFRLPVHRSLFWMMCQHLLSPTVNHNCQKVTAPSFPCLVRPKWIVPPGRCLLRPTAMTIPQFRQDGGSPHHRCLLRRTEMTIHQLRQDGGPPHYRFKVVLLPFLFNLHFDPFLWLVTDQKDWLWV